MATKFLKRLIIFIFIILISLLVVINMTYGALKL